MKTFKIKLALFILIGISFVARKSVCKEYTVQPGDQLIELAIIDGVSEEEILAANPPDKFIPVCIGEKEFTAENGKKFKLCRKTTYWLKAGTEIKIPDSRRKQIEAEAALKARVGELERQNKELLAELAKPRVEVKQDDKAQSGLTNLIFAILGFCVLMSAAIIGIIFYLRKIARRISQNGNAYKAAELANQEAKLAIEMHNFWERQKEMASIMADLKQEKIGLTNERKRLEEERKRLGAKEELRAKEIDLERIKQGLKNWTERRSEEFKKRSVALEGKERELEKAEKTLEENLESLDLGGLDDETTLGQDGKQSPGSGEKYSTPTSDETTQEIEEVEEVEIIEEKQPTEQDRGWENNPTRRFASDSKTGKKKIKKNREAPV